MLLYQFPDLSVRHTFSLKGKETARLCSLRSVYPQKAARLRDNPDITAVADWFSGMMDSLPSFSVDFKLASGKIDTRKRSAAAALKGANRK